MKNLRVGFAMCGSFCTFSQSLPQMSAIADLGANIIPIMSEIASKTDTRFGKADEIKAIIENISGKSVIDTIYQAEPIGPKNLLDLLVIAPCTGNTLAKLANSITDSCVTMAAKATLRNNKPVVICVATNDGLSGSAKNIGLLLNMKGFYFVPLKQDDYNGKPTSIIADFSLIIPTINEALKGNQIQPIL